MFGKILATTALVGSAGAILIVSALALFTDTASVTNNTFATGSVDISTSPTTALVSFSGMAPGDQVTAPVTVSNAGSLQLRYAVTSTTTENTLAGELDLTVKTGVTTCTNGGFGTDGTVIYNSLLGTTGGTNIVGDPAQGSQAGDRTLNASANEILCFNVTLPTSATNAAQSLSTTATFAFEAEQTSSNP